MAILYSSYHEREEDRVDKRTETGKEKRQENKREKGNEKRKDLKSLETNQCQVISVDHLKNLTYNLFISLIYHSADSPLQYKSSFPRRWTMFLGLEIKVTAASEISSTETGGKCCNMLWLRALIWRSENHWGEKFTVQRYSVCFSTKHRHRQTQVNHV